MCTARACVSVIKCGSWSCVLVCHVGRACSAKAGDVRHSCWRCEDVFHMDGMVGSMQEREVWLRCICEKVTTGVR